MELREEAFASHRNYTNIGIYTILSIAAKEDTKFYKIAAKKLHNLYKRIFGITC